MRPLLVVGLVASLALSGLAAWWPTADDAAGLLPAARTPGRLAAGPGPAAAADPGRAAVPPVAPAAAPAAAPPVMPVVPVVPATPSTTAASASVLSAGPTAASALAPPAAALPTRAADWPAPGAAALAAWQGGPAAAPASPATAASANPAAPATPPLPVFPYQWIGQLDDGGAPQALLASAQRSVGVRQGAVVDGRWRLDRAPGEPWKATHLPTGLVVSVRGAPPAAEP